VGKQIAHIPSHHPIPKEHQSLVVAKTVGDQKQGCGQGNGQTPSPERWRTVGVAAQYHQGGGRSKRPLSLLGV